MLTLILGGARSGKSALAEAIASASRQAVTYVATLEALDEEMAARIAAHRAGRPSAWTTVEAPRDVGRAAAACTTPVIVLDCVTVWVSNLLLDAGDGRTADEDAAVQRAIAAEVAAFARWATDAPADVIAVSNDVGAGVVPVSAMGRAFRDCLGAANQALAASATRVYWTQAGLGIELRALGARSIAEIARGDHEGRPGRVGPI